MKEFVYTFHIREGQHTRSVAIIGGYLEQAENKLRREDPLAVVTAVERRPLHAFEAPPWR